MRKFYDALVFHKDCVEFGKNLGYADVSYDVDCIVPKKAADIKPKNGRITFVKGGALEINRTAVRRRGVQVLLDPVTEKANYFDTAIAQIAKDHGVAIGISLDSILRTQGSARMKLFRNLMFMIKICRKMKLDIILVSGAHDICGMRAPRDLAGVGVLLGLDPSQALWAISEVPRSLR